MVFTVFSAHPVFAVTLGLYIFSPKNISILHWFFVPFFIKNQWKSGPRSPSTKKSTFGMLFLDFWSILGPLGGAQGGTFFEKTWNGGDFFWPWAFFLRDFFLLGPLFRKSCVFYPLRPPFWWHFWCFVGKKKNITSGLQFCSLLFLHPLHLTAQLVLTTRPGGMREAIK